jgi:hypothetical protein
VPQVRGWNLGLGVAVSLLMFPMPAGLQRYYNRGSSALHYLQLLSPSAVFEDRTRATRTTTPRPRFKRRTWGTLRVVLAHEMKICSFDRQE